MVEQNAGKFISSLIKSLQMVCHGYMDFSDNIEIIGHINLRIDNRQKFDYIVNEQVSKKGGESTVFLSNSYHSLPPGKGSGGERERAFSSKFEEDGNVNNHHRLDDGVGGSRIQVDLSGPVPVTRSTSAPSHDGFFSTAGNNLRRSQSRDSRLHSMEEDPALATSQQDHSFNHSSSAPSKDREQMEREEAGLASNRGGTGDRNEHNSVLTMYKETAIARQQSLDHRQDVIVKPEPNDLFNSSVDDIGGLTRDSDVLDASSTSGILPAAHQSATVLATAAHTGHTMLAATTLGHPGFFDASLTSQDVTDTGESSYHSVALSKERDLGQDLSEQSSQNGDGEAMSLVTRARTPPDLSYPQGPTQLPQTANITEKEITPVPEKNHCSHCSKNFRTSDLLSMHIALIHTRRNYLPPKSLLSSPSSYLSSSAMSPSQSQAGMTRRASQSPGHQSTSSNSSRSKSQSPISMMSHTQPMALIQPLTSAGPQLTSSPSCLGMALPNLPNTMSSTASHDLSSVNVTAATIAALAQSYAYDPPQVGPMMGGQGAGSLQGSSHQCHLCHMPFVSWALLAQHQSNCPRRGPHRCEQCGKAFRSKTSLTDHINTIHRGVLFICRGCRETFKWRTHIYQHKRKCPALVNLTFESGSFIEEVYPSNPPAEVPPSTSMAPLPDENMVETNQMN